MLHRALLYLLFLSIYSQSHAQAQAAIQVKAAQTNYSLEAQIYRTIQNRPHPYQFEELTTALPFETAGKLPANCLVRCLLHNADSTTQHLVFYITNNQVDTIRLYERKNNQIKGIYNTGYLMDFVTRPVQLTAFYLPVSIEPGTTKELFLHLIKNDRDATTRIQLMQQATAFEQRGNRNLMVAFFTGIIFFAFLYNLLLYINTRNTLYLSYCAYVISVSFYMLYDEGMVFKYLIPTHPIHNANLYHAASFLSVGFSINFITAFLAQGKPRKGLNEKLLQLMMQINFASAAIVTLFNPLSGSYTHEKFMHLYLYFVITASAIIITIHLINQALNKNPFAWFYIAASAILSVAVVYLILNFVGIIDNKALRINLLYAGILSEIVLLSFYFAWEYNRLQKQITEHQKQLYLQLINIQEQERKRIAQDLHDGVLGFLGALRLFVNSKTKHYQHQPELSNNFNHIQQKLDTAIHDIRNLSHDLMPKDFEHITLNQLLEHHFNELNQQQNTTRFHYIGDEKINQLPQHIRINVYRIITELAANILRHANAANATIQCINHQHYLLLQAEDDGNGFNTQQNTTGIGLKNIHSRIEYLKGKITIDSNKFATTFIIEIPIEES